MEVKIADHYYYLAITFILIWFVGCLWSTFKFRKITIMPAFDGQECFFSREPWHKKLNYGACFCSPIWLVANGFWLSAVLFVFVNAIFAPFGIIISLVLLFKGTEWSWGDGSRWANNYYEFSNEQYFWNIVGLLFFSCTIIIFLISIKSA